MEGHRDHFAIAVVVVVWTAAGLEELHFEDLLEVACLACFAEQVERWVLAVGWLDCRCVGDHDIGHPVSLVA